MEKLYIYILDVIKYLEVKAQEKSQRKKYWVLGNQYIQEVDDVDDNKMCLDQDFAKKAKCVYQAAKTGMKEGVLAGIFLGGFYGLFKNLNENVGNALLPPCVIMVNSSGDGNDQNVTEKNETVNETVNETDNKITEQSDNTNHQPESDFREQTIVRESASVQNKKRGKSTYTKSEPPDRGSEGKMGRRPISAGQSANENSFAVENVRPNTVTNIVSNKSKVRGREKVEIVGYAFVHTLGSKGSDISNSTSSDDDKRKRDNRKEEDESDSQNRPEPQSSLNSDHSCRLSGTTYPKNVLASIEEVRRKKEYYQKNGDRGQVEQTKSSSSLILSSTSSQDSYPAQVLLEIKSRPNLEDIAIENRAFETQAYVTNVTRDRKNLELERQNHGQSTTILSRQKSMLDKGKMGSNKGNKKNVSKGIRFPAELIETKDSKSDIKRGEKSSKSKKGLCKFKKGCALNKPKKSEGSKRMVFDAYCENIFMPHKISKSILVDADVISNGYSVSLNNESSEEKINPQTEFKFKAVDDSGQRMHLFIEPSKTTIKDDDSIAYSAKKKLAFAEPEPEKLEKSTARSESPSQSPTQVQEDNSNSESIDSTSSDSESGSASHSKTPENLNEPVQGIQSHKIIPVENVKESVSPAKISEEAQPVSGSGVEPSGQPMVVEPAPVLTGHTSPKTVPIGDTAPASFVHNEPSSNVQSKELSHEKTNDRKIVGNELVLARVRGVKDSQFSGAPRNRCHILKNVSDSLILLSACNCALVLGVICAVVSSTKASLSF